MGMTDKSHPAPAANPAPGPQCDTPAGSVPEDEINLLEIAYVLVKYKAVIILFSVAGLIGGYFLAKAKGPTYLSNATIMVRESDNRQMPSLGALGALGGFAAAQLNLNMANSPGLDKIGIHLDSRSFRVDLIEEYGLFEDIYRYGASKFFRKFYDTTSGRWSEEDDMFRKPAPENAAGLLGKKFLGWDIDIKTGVMTVTVKSPDSMFTVNTIEGTLNHLNRFIQTKTQTDAKDNVDYLEEQLLSIADPLLREKLLTMIASEIERAMIISKEAFTVIDRPYAIRKYHERLLYPLLGGFLMFLISSVVMVFSYYALGGGNTGSEARRWIDMIRKQLFRII